MPRRKRYLAWAAVGRESGKVLRNLQGHYAIYTRFESAEADCPKYGDVRRVEIEVIGPPTIKLRTAPSNSANR